MEKAEQKNDTRSTADDSRAGKNYFGRLCSGLLIATLLSWAISAGQHASVSIDTKTKLQRAARAAAEMDSRRASRYAELIVACLNGGGISQGNRTVRCVEQGPHAKGLRR